MFKKYFLFTLLAVTFHMAAIAQNSAELKSLINESFGYFPKLQELQQNELIAQGKLKNTRSNQLPTVAGTVSYNYINPIGEASLPIGPGITKTLQFQPNNNFNANVAANYVLLDFGRLRSAVEKSKEELKYSQQTIVYNKTQLASQVAGIYYYVIYLRKAIFIQDSVIRYYQENKSLVESKLRNGDALKVDLYNIQASIDNELNRKVDLENALQKQLNLLEYTTGKTTITASSFDFDIAAAPLDEYLKNAESQNSEFALAKSKVLQAQSELRFNKRLLTPTLNATAAAGFRNGYQPDIFQNRFNYLAGLSLNVPIYTGGKLNAQVFVAEQSLKQSEIGLRTLNNAYRKDIKQALTDVESNKERLKNSESQIQSAQSLLLLTQSRYKNGVATYLDITYAANGLQRAALARLQYEYQLCMAKIELARLSGVVYW
ncbi:MAG: hypothetical protein CFE21_04960 [Bacteroidetes bacterium B1(2017)]|nr:MAG: hypothetical protein CFE21_04960 [Bacteroidetes bacterium B1(2017)]